MPLRYAPAARVGGSCGRRARRRGVGMKGCEQSGQGDPTRRPYPGPRWKKYTSGSARRTSPGSDTTLPAAAAGAPPAARPDGRQARGADAAPPPGSRGLAVRPACSRPPRAPGARWPCSAACPQPHGTRTLGPPAHIFSEDRSVAARLGAWGLGRAPGRLPTRRSSHGQYCQHPSPDATRPVNSDHFARITHSRSQSRHKASRRPGA